MSSTLPATDKREGSEIIYVDLDALLDTRLGTLAYLKNEYAVNALSNDYMTRDRDEFKDVSYEVFKKAYEKRDIDTLKLSTFTNVFTLLQSCIKSTFETAATNSNIKPIQVQVNVYPYKLDEEEMSEISIAVWSRLKEMVDVNVVNINDVFLTPAYCKDQYSMMIRYDYQSWLKIHHDSHAFDKVKMPTVSIVAPAIYQSRPSVEELEELQKQSIHPFDATEFSLAPFFTLRLVDISVFSINKQILNIKNKSNDGIKVEGSEPLDSMSISQTQSSSVTDDGFDTF